jgi:hypothetical protein
MRAYVENTPNPFRKSYTYRGQTLNPQDTRINLAFLTTWSRKWNNTLGYHTTNPDAPNRTWGPGTVHEFTVDLSEMRTQACRISFYLLPAYENDSNAYTVDGTRGIENDAPEIDFLNGYENYAQGKVISGLAAGNTPSGSINLDDIIPGIDLTTGIHTFTLLWQKDRFVWYVDGREYKRDTDPRRIPQVPHYWVISREANSGIRPQGEGGAGVLDDGVNAYSDGTSEMPVDVGIWGRPVYEEIGQLNNDTARILSFGSWRFTDTSTPGVGIGDDTSGISPTITSADPPTVWASNTSFTFTWDRNGRTVFDWLFELGKTRGGNELGSAWRDGVHNSVTMTPGQTYNGPVNGRLWFRETASSPWHWRDFGFSSGLQPYRMGTDGKIRVTTSPGDYVASLPTVGGLGWSGVGNGWDGTFANTLDYSNGVVPAGYSTGWVEGGGDVEPAKVLTSNRYSAVAGEILWDKGSFISFNVYRNGVLIAEEIDAASLFMGDLPNTTSYTFSVYGLEGGIEVHDLGDLIMSAWLAGGEGGEDPPIETAAVTSVSRYSATAGEIFWEKGSFVSFNIYRDGVLVVGGIDAASYYTEALSSAVSYTFSVYGVIDGVESYDLGDLVMPAFT